MKTPAFLREVISFMAVNDKFNYHFLVRANIVSRKGFGTMGVSVEGYKIFYYFDPEFVKELTEPELIFVLRHEVMHLVLHHCDTRNPAEPHRRKLANIAMDLAINPLIPNNASCSCPTHKKEFMGVDPLGRPKLVKVGDRMGMFPEDFGYPNKLSYEQYMELLERDFPRQSNKDKGDEGGGEGYPGEPMPGTAMDNHDGFSENPAVAADIRNQIQNISKSQSWGNMPGDLKAVIELAQKSEISWRALIRHEYGKFVRYAREFSIRRPNKKYGYPFPGLVSNSYTDAAYVYADTSASVCDEELGHFLRETSELARRIPVYFRMFDTELAGKPTLIKGVIRKSFIVQGRGGTDFQACFDDAIKNKARKIILFSDGFANEPDYKDFKGQILWVITKSGNPKVRDWRGRKVYLNNV